MELIWSVHLVYIVRIPSLELSLTSPLVETIHLPSIANLASFGARNGSGKKERQGGKVA
jgi:hypothetical protein